MQVNFSRYWCKSLYIYHHGDTIHQLIFNWYVGDCDFIHNEIDFCFQVAQNTHV